MKKFEKIVSDLGLPKALSDELLEAWNVQVDSVREQIIKEVREENSNQMQTEIDRIVEAAQELVVAATTELSEVVDAKLANLNEAKRKVAIRSKKLREMKDSIVEREKQLVESMAKQTASILAEEIKVIKQTTKHEEAALADERLRLVRENTRVSKINKSHIDAFAKLAEKVLADEIKELHEDRNNTKMKLESEIAQLSNVMHNVISEEIKELQADRQLMIESVENLKDMTVSVLTTELTEFHEDKMELEKERKRLVESNARKLEETKKQWLEQSSKQVEKLVESVLYPEISALKEDIAIARKNDFGMTIFESFASQFSAMFFNENKEIRKYAEQLEENTKNMQKMQQIIAEQNNAINKTKKELRESQEKHLRESKIADLTKSLSGLHKNIMLQYLRTTPTSKLDETFKHALPKVLNESASKITTVPEKKGEVTNKRLTESTGSRTKKPLSTAPVQFEELDSEQEINSILKNAGYNK